MRTRTPTGTEDKNFFRCKRCHFPCNTERDRTSGSESGVTLVEKTIGLGTAFDPVVSAGCSFCGTFNYKTWQR